MAVQKKTRSLPPYLIDTFQQIQASFTATIGMKPWEIVDESEIFAVQHPGTGGLYYAYFMGGLGEVIGFNIYKESAIAGWLYTLGRMQNDTGDSFHPEEMLSHTFFQLNALKKSEADTSFKELYAAAGINLPRGQKGYCEAISYRAGFVPVMMTGEDMQEVLPVLPGFRYLLQQIADSGDDSMPVAHEGDCYTAVPDGRGNWTTEVRRLPAPEEVNLYDAKLPAREYWQSLIALPPAKDDYIIHAALLSAASYEDEQQVGIFPIILLCLSKTEGLILGMKLIAAQEWKVAAAGELRELLADIGRLPIELLVVNPQLLPLVASCAAELHIKARLDSQARHSVREMMDSMGAMMRGGGMF